MENKISSSSSSYTSVIYVKKRHAKEVKVALERENLLDRDYRMTAASVVARSSNQEDASTVVGTSVVSSVSSSTQEATVQFSCGVAGAGAGESVSSSVIASISLDDCIAIPILPIDDDVASISSSWMEKVVGRGMQNCPYSTSILGNTKRGMLKSIRTAGTSTSSTSSLNKHEPSGGWNAVQRVLIHTIRQFISSSSSSASDNQNYDRNDTQINTTKGEELNELGECGSSIELSVASLSKKTCPNKLEFIGDDRTLVIPQTALHYTTHECNQRQDDNEESSSSSLRSIIVRFILPPSPPPPPPTIMMVNGYTIKGEKVERDDDGEAANTTALFMTLLWSNLAQTYGSTRVVRRGDIDPESKVRASGHTILWTSTCDHKPSQLTLDCNATTTESRNIGWITITEHGILQSFDLTKIMFSRGNVNEKLRFGRTLVQTDEIVLDMYAGIGYYTLPALLLGKAKHVYACEWNSYAVLALRYNLMQNGIVGAVAVGAADKSDRVTVLEGDSRITLSSSSSVYYDILRRGGVDRISLGLLPSSEGGWKTALSVLNRERGGWLHIHGNVPTSERDTWAFWICTKIDDILSKERASSITSSTPTAPSTIVCSHIQKVKSFAPKIDHLVADLFVGPQSSPGLDDLDRKGYRMCIVTRDGEVVECPNHVDFPSCALGGGVLDQEWMVDCDTIDAR